MVSPAPHDVTTPKIGTLPKQKLHVHGPSEELASMLTDDPGKEAMDISWTSVSRLNRSITRFTENSSTSQDFEMLAYAAAQALSPTPHAHFHTPQSLSSGYRLSGSDLSPVALSSARPSFGHESDIASYQESRGGTRRESGQHTGGSAADLTHTFLNLSGDAPSGAAALTPISSQKTSPVLRQLTDSFFGRLPSPETPSPPKPLHEFWHLQQASWLSQLPKPGSSPQVPVASSSAAAVNAPAASESSIPTQPVAAMKDDNTK
jgi:hypothetical protein